jgi:hypothetical protein
MMMLKPFLLKLAAAASRASGRRDRCYAGGAWISRRWERHRVMLLQR